ncbi:activating signal cointegrator 1 complex subunit 1 isoform X1 [Bradysia coprophila]|uniref:activating signal cointegrator 1 complex subunit 1 isoform X1 n=1 Tax=Bradysia coprophila TaxID=38358 RepID=UPI00187DB555|nr:activating signal cointegrator 1 complex subunit 1 isoform X1 [Bradysia coprophila]
MDIIAPQLLWIHGRCYRVNPTVEIADINEGKRNVDEIVRAGFESFQTEDDDFDNEECYDIDQAPNNQFRTAFDVPSILYGVLVGAKGSTKKRIQFETKTTIKIPKQGVDGPVEIVGSTKSSVISARRRLELIILAARTKQEKTHFLCVPVKHQTVREKFVQFKNQILLNRSITGIDESMFQNINKLHITFGTLSLLNSADRILATELFQESRAIVDKIRSTSSNLAINIRGVEIMNDDASSCNVLYGKVDSPQLQIIADETVNRFIAKGLMQRQYDRVKLHVTLINTRFVNGGEADNARTFDCRSILDTYADYEFGTQNITEIHLSTRYTTATDGFYEATYRLKL